MFKKYPTFSSEKYKIFAGNLTTPTLSSGATIVKSISMNKSLKIEFIGGQTYNGKFSLGNNQNYKKLCWVSRWVEVVKLCLAKSLNKKQGLVCYCNETDEFLSFVHD